MAAVSSVNSRLFKKTECVGELQGMLCVAGSVSALSPSLLSQRGLLSTLICKLTPVRLPSYGDKCVYIHAKHWHARSFDYNMKHKTHKKELRNHLNANCAALHQCGSLTVTQTSLCWQPAIFLPLFAFVYDPIIFLWTHTIIQCFSVMHWGCLQGLLTSGKITAFQSSGADFRDDSRDAW